MEHFESAAPELESQNYPILRNPLEEFQRREATAHPERSTRITAARCAAEPVQEHHRKLGCDLGQPRQWGVVLHHPEAGAQNHSSRRAHHQVWRNCTGDVLHHQGSSQYHQLRGDPSSPDRRRQELRRDGSPPGRQCTISHCIGRY